PGGMKAMDKLLSSKHVRLPPFAPPILKAGNLVLSQTANILFYLGDRHGLAPHGEPGRLWAHQLQLTVADFVQEIHNTHHPISPALYFEDQRKEARRYTDAFRKHRLPKFLAYFERALAQNPAGDGHLVGRRLTYPDLSLFQVVSGLRYAFPRTMQRTER